MTDDWRITEHSPNVALQLANQWAIAVGAQARRIQNPDNSQERIPDAYIQVLALLNLLRAAELAKKTVPSRAATDEIKKAIRAFLDAVVVVGTISNRDNAQPRRISLRTTGSTLNPQRTIHNCGSAPFVPRKPSSPSTW